MHFHFALVRGWLQLLDAHVAAERMVELRGPEEDGHAVVDLGDELVRLTESWRGLDPLAGLPGETDR